MPGPPMAGPPMAGPPMAGPPMARPPMGGPPMAGPPMAGPPMVGMGGPPMGGPPIGGMSGPPMGGPPMGGMAGPPMGGPPMGMGGPPMGMGGPPMGGPPMGGPPMGGMGMGMGMAPMGAPMGGMGTGMGMMGGGMGMGKSKKKKKKKKIAPKEAMKPFHWERLNEKKVMGTLWEDIDDMEIKADLFEDAFVSNFKKDVKKKKGKGKHDSGDSSNKKQDKQQEVNFVDGKRKQQVGLILQKFKLVPITVREQILAFDEENLIYAQIEQLANCMPTKEECDQVSKKYEEYDSIANWGKVETFFYHMHDIERISERLTSWLFMLEFEDFIESLDSKLHEIHESYEVISESVHFRQILQIVLRLGNYMNGKGSKGAATGFKLDALSGLSAIKSADKKQSMLEWITQLVEKEFPDAIEWVDEFETVSIANRLEAADLENEKKEIDGYMNEMEEMLQDLRTLEKAAKQKEANEEFPENAEEDDGESHDPYIIGMSKFQKEALKRVEELTRFWDDTFEFGVKTLKLYGEKADKPWEDFSDYFKTFREDWIKACNDVEDRKKKEAKQKKMENAKRKVNKKLGKRPRRETLVQKGLIKDYVKQALAAPPVQSTTGRHQSVHLADSHKRKIKEEADALLSRKSKKKKKKKKKKAKETIIKPKTQRDKSKSFRAW